MRWRAKRGLARTAKRARRAGPVRNVGLTEGHRRYFAQLSDAVVFEAMYLTPADQGPQVLSLLTQYQLRATPVIGKRTDRRAVVQASIWVAFGIARRFNKADEVELPAAKRRQGSTPPLEVWPEAQAQARQARSPNSQLGGLGRTIWLEPGRQGAPGTAGREPVTAGESVLSIRRPCVRQGVEPAERLSVRGGRGADPRAAVGGAGCRRRARVLGGPRGCGGRLGCAGPDAWHPVAWPSRSLRNDSPN